MKLALGTVQFGLDYGITNSQGQVSGTEVKKILALAQSEGIDTIDCAIAYGNSEEILGATGMLDSFKVITKIPPMTSSKLTIEQHIEQSLSRLHIEEFEAVLFHHANDLESVHGQDYFDALLQVKNDCKTRKVGASLYDPQQLDRILDKHTLDIVQAPCNWLDQRFITKGVNQYEFHGRSLFLQGLLLSEINDLPSFISPYKSEIKPLHDLACALNCSLLTLCLGILFKFHSRIDRAVIGCCSEKQLAQIIESYYQAMTLEELCEISAKELNSCNELLINPATWPINK